MATKDVDTIIIYAGTELPANDCKVKFTNEHGRKYNIELTRLIQYLIITFGRIKKVSDKKIKKDIIDTIISTTKELI